LTSCRSRLREGDVLRQEKAAGRVQSEADDHNARFRAADCGNGNRKRRSTSA
jgi:hypothetical protein